jgi:Rrf2 family protein
VLKLTKKADYGLIAMRYLAENGAASASAKDIAEAHGIPAELLAKILQKLVKARLLTSLHGINGGYLLARDARTISALEVIKAIEGPLFLTSCVTTRGECGHTSRCTVREPLRKVSQSIEEVLSKITIGDMGDGASAVVVPDELVTLS